MGNKKQKKRSKNPYRKFIKQKNRNLRLARKGSISQKEVEEKMGTILVRTDPDLESFAEDFIDWFAEYMHFTKPHVKIRPIQAFREWKLLADLFSLTAARNVTEHKALPPRDQADGLLIPRKAVVGRIERGLTPARRKKAHKELQEKLETLNQFFAGEDYVIFLNVQFLRLQSVFEKVTFDHKVKEVLAHELIHAFEHENNTTIITKNDDEKVNDLLGGFATANPKWVC